MLVRVTWPVSSTFQADLKIKLYPVDTRVYGQRPLGTIHRCIISPVSQLVLFAGLGSSTEDSLGQVARNYKTEGRT